MMREWHQNFQAAEIRLRRLPALDARNLFDPPHPGKPLKTRRISPCRKAKLSRHIRAPGDRIRRVASWALIPFDNLKYAHAAHPFFGQKRHSACCLFGKHLPLLLHLREFVEIKSLGDTAVRES